MPTKLNNTESLRKGEGPATPRGGLPERDRLLAAAGWERDPRRRKILRELLEEQRRRVYLWSYADSGQRAGAIDRTRRALLRAARTLDQIPDRCSLSAWIYLDLEAEMGRTMDCPEPWEILATVESDAGATGPESAARAASSDREGLERHLDAHPNCRDMRDGYRRFLALPSDADLAARSGWDRAALDLDHFFRAQFGEEPPAAVSGGAPWRHALPSMPWARSRGVAIAFAVAVVVLGVFLWRALQSAHGPMSGRGTDQTTVAGQTHDARREPGTGPELIHNATTSMEGSQLVFRWDRNTRSERYRLRILTAQLDTLKTLEGTDPQMLRVPPAEVPGLTSGGSYLFQVDGFKGDLPVASSGLIPFRFP
jgi:hypothetical protein